MYINRNIYFMGMGLILSLGLAITIFGGFTLYEIVLTETTNGSEPKFIWNTNSTDDLIDEMEERNSYLKRITFMSGELIIEDNSHFSPWIIFENFNAKIDISSFSANHLNDNIWRVNVTGNLTEVPGSAKGFFYLNSTILSEINNYFSLNLEILHNITNEIVEIDSIEWRTVHLNDFIQITHCYSDGSAVILEILVFPGDLGKLAYILTTGTWHDKNGTTVVSYPNEMAGIIYQLIPDINPFEPYLDSWNDVIREASIFIVPGT